MEVRVFVTPTLPRVPGMPGPSYAPNMVGTRDATPARLLAAEKAAREAAQVGPGKDTGRGEFLHLLTTQLKYQDPFKPMEDYEFVAQLAQFSTLEELQNLNRRMEDITRLQLWVSGMGQATLLIGRHVTLELADGTTVSGKVEAVRMKEGTPYVAIGGEEYPVTRVVKVE